jgi:choline dehydrogenase-like flavoprotein
MPTVTRGNTHAPAVMIGERSAELLRQEAGKTPPQAASVPVTAD